MIFCDVWDCISSGKPSNLESARKQLLVTTKSRCVENSKLGMPIIPAFRRQKQEDQEPKVILGYKMSWGQVLRN